MDIYFERLKNRAGDLGNHYKKYIVTIDKYIDKMMGRLEMAGAFERVHLWGTAHDYAEEMNIIAELGKDEQEKLNDLGCYFAIQFLQMNINALDTLVLELTRNENKLQVYKTFMLRTGHDFRFLTAAYMDNLLKLYMPPDINPEFVFLGVGTRSDQDDIDIGVVDKGDKHRDILNKCIGKMNAEMFKKAISLHFHISEHVGNETSYSASIAEYSELLDNEIHDFVIITEMLGAARILGSRKLFFDFRQNITSRYYYYNSESKGLKFHEGYLRGIVGETRSFMFRELSKKMINPKADGLRMIKGLLYAAKTIYYLRQVNSWAILDELSHKDKRRSHLFSNLEWPLTFLEVFRYLYQLLIAQEEEIYLNDRGTKHNLDQIAELMGYKSIGAASATDFLLTDYYKNIMQAKSTVKSLVPFAVQHLESITIFGKVLRHKKVTEEGEKRIGNLAERFLKETLFFRGTRFWDDIITVLDSKNGRVLKRLANDINALPEDKKEKMLEKFNHWGWNSFISLFSLITLFYKYRYEIPDPTLYSQLNKIFFKRLIVAEEIAQRISTVFTHFPQLLHEYVSLLSEDQQRKLYLSLDYNVWDKEVEPARDRLRYLLKLYFSTGKYYKLRMKSVLAKHSAYLNYLDSFEQLSLIGKGTLAESERTKQTRQKFDHLKSYHEFEFFRVGMVALHETSSVGISVQYTDFSDNYLRLLFDTCKKEEDENRGYKIKTRDLLGVFVTGGQGQMQAFDDDYDLIILLNSDDKNIQNYCFHIIKRMHKEILKCGILPHYRLADLIGSYICTFSQLRSVLMDKTFDRFIDKAQLIGARMIIGSSILQKEFQDKLLTPFIYKDKENFSFELVNEIESRHNYEFENKPSEINIKETKGGIRDIELLLCLFRAIYQIHEPSNFKLFILLQSILPNYAHEFKKLFRSYDFLRRMRILYRLSVSAEDNIEQEHLAQVLENMSHQNKKLTPELLFKRIQSTTRSINRTNQNIIHKVILPQIAGQNNKNLLTKKNKTQ